MGLFLSMPVLENFIFEDMDIDTIEPTSKKEQTPLDSGLDAYIISLRVNSENNRNTVSDSISTGNTSNLTNCLLYLDKLKTEKKIGEWYKCGKIENKTILVVEFWCKNSDKPGIENLLKIHYPDVFIQIEDSTYLSF